MTVEELKGLLAPMPDTARVTVRIRKNVAIGAPLVSGGTPLEDLYEWREADPDAVLYDLGEVVIQLDE